jgi:hypothetical protein
MLDVVKQSLDTLNRGIAKARPEIAAQFAAIRVRPGYENQWAAVQAKLPRLVQSLRFTYHLGDLGFEVTDPALTDLWLQLKRGTAWHDSIDTDDIAEIAARKVM